MEDLYRNLKEGRQVRETLAEMRSRAKDAEERAALRGLMAEDLDLCAMLLSDEDPKARKNAALLIGDLEAQGALGLLYEAYAREQTLFVRSAYLKAMESLEVGEYLDRLQERQEELLSQEVAEENRKHYREELQALERLLEKYHPSDRHVFRGEALPWDVVLTTNRLHREVTARQVQGSRVSLLPMGVKVLSAKLPQLLQIRTWQELLFLLNISLVPQEPEEAAHVLAGSDLWGLLERAQGPMDACKFRITIQGTMPLEQRGAFIKKCSFALEEQSGRRLLNSASDYEAELRLWQRKDGTFFPMLKLHTLEDARFAYRKGSVATSRKPYVAALLAQLARPYLKRGARVLDPFCGVGTFLIERDQAVPAGAMYGVDTFGEAIQKAKENARLAGRDIHFVNRDFFTFTHEVPFDEIFTEFPARGKKEREEQDRLYQQFFERAERLLRQGGVLLLLSDERGHVMKQLRLHPAFRLLQEFCMDEKERFFFSVIEKGKTEKTIAKSVATP